MSPPNYYHILDIPQSATDAQIKQAYRKLAMKWHPDKNPTNAEEASQKFQEISEAFSVLGDLEKKAIYDQYGYDRLKEIEAEEEDITASAQTSKKLNPQEIFEKFFGTNNPFAVFNFEAAPFTSKLNKPEPKKGPTVTINLDCTLRELYNGCTKKVEITRKRFNEQYALEDTVKTLTIKVRPGWKTGTKVTFADEGDEGINQLASDVIFVVNEVSSGDSESYKREGNDLIYTHKLSLLDALTDCTLLIPTLDDRKLSIACPEVVSPFYEKKIIGEGMPISKTPGQRGNLLIRFHILFPKHLNGAKRDKIRELLANEELLN